MNHEDATTPPPSGRIPAANIQNAGSVAVGGDVIINAGIAAGRDLLIDTLTLLVDDGPPFGDAIARPGGPSDRCPYPGIAAFDASGAGMYFGRDSDVEAVLGLIDRGARAAVIGSSGSGKSSLLAAGIAPALERGAIAGSESWVVIRLRPTRRPLTKLAAEVGRRLTNSTPLAVERELRRDARSFATFAAMLASQSGRPVLWVVDQFEEIFAAPLSEDNQKESDGFVAALLSATAGPRPDNKLLLALRSDFYPHLDRYPELADAVAHHQRRLLPLSPTTLPDIVVKPAEAVGLRVEPALVDAILADLGTTRDYLPLLAYALQETWRRRRNGWLTVAGYAEAGGLTGALARGATQVWEQLDASQRDTARRMLLRLSRQGEGTSPTRRRLPVTDLVTDLDSAAEVAIVVQKFAAARLLTVDLDDAPGRRMPMVEVSHEALLRDWPLSQRWLEEDREAKRAQEDLADGASAWVAHGKDAAYLYRGARLAALLASSGTTPLATNDAERGFLAASRRVRVRQRARRICVVALPVLLLLLLLAVKFPAYPGSFLGFDDLASYSDLPPNVSSNRPMFGYQLVTAVITLNGSASIGRIEAIPQPFSPFCIPAGDPEGNVIKTANSFTVYVVYKSSGSCKVHASAMDGLTENDLPDITILVSKTDRGTTSVRAR